MLLRLLRFHKRFEQPNRLHFLNNQLLRNVFLVEVAGNEFYIVQIYNPSCGKPILEVRDIKDNNKVRILSPLLGIIIDLPWASRSIV